MYPVIEVFGRQIGTYSLISLAGMALAALFVYKKVKIINADSGDVILMLLAIIGGIFTGGHIFYAATQYKYVALSVKLLFNGAPAKTVFAALSAAFGGQVFYGGLFCSVFAVFLMTRKKSALEKQVWMDAYAAAVPLFHCFGRIGCFFGGCCYGIESVFGFIVHKNIYNPSICGVRRFPTPLLEALVNLLIFAVISTLINKQRLKGRLIWVYGVLYSFCRFFIEYLRGDSIRGVYFGISFSQWISVLLFIVSAFVIIIKTKKHNGEENAAC